MSEKALRRNGQYIGMACPETRPRTVWFSGQRASQQAAKEVCVCDWFLHIAKKVPT